MSDKIDQLKINFEDLLSNYTSDPISVTEMWTEIEVNYSGAKRHYHTLEHLANLLEELHEVKEKIIDWKMLMFTLFYHDIIYNAQKSDNEEKSADLAEKRMMQLSISAEKIDRCKAQILATKSHHKSDDADANYFTDADLSILASSWESYSRYCENVRKEYAIYPDLVYKLGRRKVLNHFLKMDRIYKTDHFFKKFEERAKENLMREMDLL